MLCLMRGQEGEVIKTANNGHGQLTFLATSMAYVLEVVIVMCLGRGQEGEVVAAVRDAGGYERQTEPEEGVGDV